MNIPCFFKTYGRDHLSVYKRGLKITYLCSLKVWIKPVSSLRRRRTLTLVSDVCEASPRYILVVGPQRTQRITGGAFGISFTTDWQINDVFFHRPIIASHEYSNLGTQLGSSRRI